MAGCAAAAASMASGIGAAAWAAVQAARGAPSAATRPADRYVTCFYQFTPAALAALTGEKGLPDGPEFLHIFSHSHPGLQPRPETARAVHARGSSFKYAPAFDVHKYKGWISAGDEQLRAWAIEFRKNYLDTDAPADYFAFNEMPTTGAQRPDVRAAAARLCRFLHDPGDNRPPLPGVFYFTEKNVMSSEWQGEQDSFWNALDETCDLVVGEHYHNYGFVFMSPPEQYAANHLFALPRRLIAGGKAAQVRIAREKYAVLHSSYYGPTVTGWAGLRNDQHDLAAARKYFDRVIAATRSSELGRQRIAFGPLVAKEFDSAILAPLSAALGEDARAFQQRSQSQRVPTPE